LSCQIKPFQCPCGALKRTVEGTIGLSSWHHSVIIPPPPIALILLLKRLHRHSEGAPQIWPNVDQQKYVENSKLSILFSSIFLLANPPVVSQHCL